MQQSNRVKPKVVVNKIWDYLARTKKIKFYNESKLKIVFQNFKFWGGFWQAEKENKKL